MAHPNLPQVPSTPSTGHAPEPGAEGAAFERMRPFIDARASMVLVPIRIDAASVALGVLKALPAIRALRAEVVALPGFDARNLDDLEDCAWAHLFANDQYKRATRPAEPLVQAMARAAEVRESLHAAAVFHASRGDIDAHELDKYSGLMGYKLAADDLGLLYGIFHDALPRLANKTPVTRAEVDEAGRLRQQLMSLLAVREGSPERLAEATRLRLHTYNLLLARYEEVRAAIGFIRRAEGDADILAPSLFAGRGGKPHHDAEDEEPKAENAAPDNASGAPVANGNAAPTTNAPKPAGSPFGPPNRNNPFED